MVTICCFFFYKCSIVVTRCSVTACSQWPLVQHHHHRAWSHHSHLHTHTLTLFEIRLAVVTHSRQFQAVYSLTLRKSCQSLSVVSQNAQRVSCSFLRSVAMVSALSYTSTIILSTMMCTAPSSMCNYLCRCLKKVNSNRVMWKASI